ncbi:class I SAM-dependent DNA methyltransferase [Mesobacillus zeae]|uniref:Class I SAM-dependent methyltransferase n=1 Tax=Mesobacillus zeae TaxID=1917180 RepID=A0A398B4M8_9BACI|nr:class I SAM-dependent methyltransferase [Mesobacillus zeae]RID83778.1 class I SAM-dependent methyltransferase [Mesobacillus zeae]
MSYAGFAYLYDELMDDVPYGDWVKWTECAAAQHKAEGKRLLEIACGTGELSVRFAEAGYTVTGLDLSEDMLAVARSKADESGYNIPFYRQDMSEMEGLGEFDVAVIFCDSLNYLESEEQVLKTFEGAFVHLKKGGLLLFDVHSVFKMNHIFADSTFTLNDEHISYIWNSFQGEFPDSVEHELTFFVQDEKTGLYRRLDESHFQRTYSPENYCKLLEKAGFNVFSVTADFKAESPSECSERIFFAAGKPSA